MSDQGSDNDSHHGQNDNMRDLNDMPVNTIQIRELSGHLLQLGAQSFM